MLFSSVLLAPAAFAAAIEEILLRPISNTNNDTKKEAYSKLLKKDLLILKKEKEAYSKSLNKNIVF